MQGRVVLDGCQGFARLLLNYQAIPGFADQPVNKKRLKQWKNCSEIRKNSSIVLGANSCRNAWHAFALSIGQMLKVHMNCDCTSNMHSTVHQKSSNNEPLVN